MSDVTIWHNTSCGSSKNALDYVKAKGVEPKIYQYLKEKPGKAEIEAVLEKLALPPSGLLRPGEKSGEAKGVYAPGVDEATILAAMIEDAKLIQRPVVITAKGAVIARPKTRIDEIL